MKNKDEKKRTEYRKPELKKLESLKKITLLSIPIP